MIKEKQAVGKLSMTLGWDGEVSVPSGTLRERHIQSPLERKNFPFCSIQSVLGRGNYPLSIIHYPLSIIHYPLSIIHYPLSIIEAFLSFKHYISITL